MNRRNITIISRKSPLALWQAEWVKHQLENINPDINCRIVGRITEGDRIKTPLTDSGGKDLFVKDLQKSLLNREADIAVHSIKDMSVRDNPDLTIAAFMQREDPRDTFISTNFRSLHELPQRAIIGTSSPRRQCQLKALRPDCEIKSIRGNLGTRLAKLDADDYDAIILAAAGLKRLQLENRICAYLDPQEFIPAIGQGAIGVECRSDDHELQKLLKSIDHLETRLCVTAERAVNYKLGGDCFTPIAAHAVIHNNQLSLSALVGKLDGTSIIRTVTNGNPQDAEAIGLQTAQKLLNQGADTIL